jgi:hypothetical protein
MQIERYTKAEGGSALEGYRGIVRPYAASLTDGAATSLSIPRSEVLGATPSGLPLRYSPLPPTAWGYDNIFLFG